MAITIRNKETEAMIRKLGKRCGEGPSAVIRRLAQEALEHEAREAEGGLARRLAAWNTLMAFAPPRDPNVTWVEIEGEMDALFDDLEEDGAPHA